jgi:hypothetical protein
MSSEPLRKANQSVVWAATRKFREEFEVQKKRAQPKKEEGSFYTPPINPNDPGYF